MSYFEIPLTEAELEFIIRRILKKREVIMKICSDYHYDVVYNIDMNNFNK